MDAICTQYLDGGPNAKQDALLQRVGQTTFQRVSVVKRSENWGIGRHLIDARRRLFDEQEYDCVLLFEDDMVLAPSYVETLLSMLSWASDYNDVGTVMAYNINPIFQNTNNINSRKSLQRTAISGAMECCTRCGTTSNRLSTNSKTVFCKAFRTTNGHTAPFAGVSFDA